MKAWTKNFLISLTCLSTAIFIHFILFEFILKIQKDYFSSIYIFIFCVLILSSLFIQVLERSFKEQLGYFFLLVVALKLVAAKVFIDSFPQKYEAEFKFSLLVLYLVSLILITWFTSKKLLNQES